MWLKITQNVVKSQKFSSPYVIDVAENDGDNRFRTGNINNVESAHAQRKMAKKTAVDTFRLPKYPPLIGNRGC